MRFGQLEMDPARNPAVLDTATWEPAGAWARLSAVPVSEWRAVHGAACAGTALPACSGYTLVTTSLARTGGEWCTLVKLPDGQQAFVAWTTGEGEPALGRPYASAPTGDGRLHMHVADAVTVDRFCRTLRPDKGPRALGATPRLGIGTRMTTAVWPGIWRAMAEGGFAANAIQNSVRELNLLDDITAGRPAEANQAFSFGTIETGYTGSTWEGLWLSGVLHALGSEAIADYGADADHLQVKRGANGLERAKRLIDASRYYSFFTLDVSDVLDYDALRAAGLGEWEGFLERDIPDAGTLRDVLLYHNCGRRIAGTDYRPDPGMLGRLVGKYWRALGAVEELTSYIRDLKGNVPFDLELSIDEHPADVPTFDCLTSEMELVFVILEMQRRGIPCTHVAPNFGVEKGVDYNCPDGLPGLARRTERLSRACADLGPMVDFHSGDDLSAETRGVIRLATGGRSHFKISPSLQLMFAEVLSDFQPNLFRRWWNDALAYAQREAVAGSPFAARCLGAWEAGGSRPDTHNEVFHHYSFAFVGRRDERGRFICRDEFYSLSPEFYRAYEDCLAVHLLALADELGYVGGSSAEGG